MALHDPYLPEKVAKVAAQQLQESLTLPNYFQKETFDKFKGAKNGTVDVKIEGVLPWRTYPWRQDPADRVSIVWDEYKERTVGVSLGQHMYSGLQLIDEQKDLDLLGWGFLTGKQTDAVANGVNYAAADYASNDDNYTVKMAIQEEKLYEGLVKLRQNLRAMHAPGSTYTLAVGTDWEAALLNSDRFNLASNVGDSRALSAVQEAFIGRTLGFNIVVIPELQPEDAIAFGQGAFLFANAAPSLPDSAPFRASASNSGVSLRVIRHYNHTKFIDESVVDTFFGFETVKDVLASRVAKTDNHLTVSDQVYNVRAVKLSLDGTGEILNTSDSGAEFTSLTGITSADLTVGTPPADDDSSSSSSSSSSSAA